jgi:hypothetical protein
MVVVISSYLGKYVYAVDFFKDVILLMIFSLALFVAKTKNRIKQNVSGEFLFFGVILDIILLVLFHFFEIFLMNYVAVVKILAFTHQLLLLILSFLSIEVFIQFVKYVN